MMIAKQVVFTALMAGFLSQGIAAADSFSEALQASELSADLRIRYERVAQSGIPQAADAMTGRVRIGIRTGELAKTSLLAEAVLIEDILDEYNSTTNGQTGYPVVADPTDFEAVNRFALINKSLQNTTVTLGRQRIVLDDSRFVGNVGWRQNEQTYDALRVEFESPALRADVAYVEQVNRIFGPDSPVGRWQGDMLLANVSKRFGFGKLTLFDYYLDIDQAAAASTNTLGARLAGSKPIGRLTSDYIVSLARQSDAAGNPAEFSATYYLLEGGLGSERFSVALGFEQLGSSGTTAVTMPLATLHAFQGWADKFLGTPATGMDDQFLRLTYRAGPVGPFDTLTVTGVLHDFDADTGSVDYGDELDIAVVARATRLAVTLKYAAYDAAELHTDTDKYWLSVDYTF